MSIYNQLRCRMGLERHFTWYITIIIMVCAWRNRNWTCWRLRLAQQAENNHAIYTWDRSLSIDTMESHNMCVVPLRGKGSIAQVCLIQCTVRSPWRCEAPSQYLNQCWFVISNDLWHCPEGNFTVIAQSVKPQTEFKNYTFKITTTYPRGQCVQFCVNVLYFLLFPGEAPLQYTPHCHQPSWQPMNSKIPLNHS